MASSYKFWKFNRLKDTLLGGQTGLGWGQRRSLHLNGVRLNFWGKLIVGRRISCDTTPASSYYNGLFIDFQFSINVWKMEENKLIEVKSNFFLFIISNYLISDHRPTKLIQFSLEYRYIIIITKPKLCMLKCALSFHIKLFRCLFHKKKSKLKMLCFLFN